MIRCVVFDFDGVIADSLGSTIQIYKEISQSYGFKQVKDQDIERLRDLEVMDALREMRVSKLAIPRLFWRWRREAAGNIDKLRPFPGWKRALQDLNAQNIKLGIVTMNSENNVRKFLQKNDLVYFDFIKSVSLLLSPLFQKAHILRRLVKNLQITPDQLIFVGDQTTDIEHGHRAGVKVIAVSWGYNTKDALARYLPDYYADHPRDINRIISRLNLACLKDSTKRRRLE